MSNAVDTILPDLFIGGYRAAEETDGYHVVVNLSGDRRLLEAPLMIDWPVADREEMPDVPTLWQLARVITESIDAGKKVLVHCAAGMDRSGLMCAAVLMLREPITGKEAMQRIRECRPGALANETFAKWLSREPAH